MQPGEVKEELSLSEQRDLLQALTESPGWRRLMVAIQGQVDSLQNEILFGPVQGTADLYRIERMKGALEGRLALAMTVQGMLDTIQQDIRNKVGDDDVA